MPVLTCATRSFSVRDMPCHLVADVVRRSVHSVDSHFVDGKHAIAGCRPRHYLWRLDYRVNLLALGQHSFLHGGRLPSDIKKETKTHGTGHHQKIESGMLCKAQCMGWFLRYLKVVQSSHGRTTWTQALASMSMQCKTLWLRWCVVFVATSWAWGFECFL